ncbi:thiamine pyrophosphate-dependent enzyme [Salinisphaera hydrothermalis]|uniref:Uncharacterized protein n=1 Tax=Salinisphaera hydrothermalis (strain C41B8) TaxID=1304275 RepID=A0A084IPG0_SALHC|nr:thiamine pyrophosphate-dependent enzyme [Salinisphaera hydrothermalis]KEZ78594.1 hypothetical protein C41B8_03226 [Salinisphaera hydrothermalis C41B8]
MHAPNPAAPTVPAPGRAVEGTTADILVETLHRRGVDTIFALPGIQNDPLFDALYHAADRVRTINPRHEQATAYMATGYGMATGRPGVCAVVPGPGLLNTTGALATAWACSAPVIALAGQIPQRMIGRGVGMLHEIHDQLGVLRHVTKSAERIAHPGQAGTLTARAFDIANTAPCRPVGLECALDVWGRTGRATIPDSEPGRAAADLADLAGLEQAAKLLARAERPLIVVGGGAQGAAEPFRRLAAALGAPVTANRMGRGVLASDDPLCVDPVAGHRLWGEADVVLAIGTRLQLQLMDWGLDERLKIIRIEADPEALDRLSPPTVRLVGNAAEVVADLLDQLPPGMAPRALGDWIEPARRAAAQALSALEPQIGWLDAIRDVLPRNGIFVDELTQLGYASRAVFPVYEPRSFLSPGYQGTLGWGFPSALGAQVACPDRKVLSINGDGGFLYNIAELATAAQHRIPLVAIVVNDRAYGNVARIQDQKFGGRRIASALNSPDFVGVAENFGVRGMHANTPDALRACLEEAFALDAPVLIEVEAGPMPDPWALLRFSPSRGRKVS